MSVVRVTWLSRWAWSSALAASLLIGGCGPKKQPTMVKPPPRIANPRPKSATDLSVRVSELSQASKALADDSKQLPGSDDASHRKIMGRVFDDLLKILPLLDNPRQNRLLAMQMSSIQNSRSQIQYGSASLAMEPSINTGLRSAAAALADLSHADYYDQATLGPILDKLSAQIDRLDLDHGPLHMVDVADAVDLVNQAAGKMAAALGERVALDSSTRPATQPSK
ncbi:MAG TPA: hypothetical protein VFC78_08505 [Tepidisphaeraceae bacterium]|nr:hypothetical protein [Tepidisphaeraceae bacterium]